MSAIIGSDWSSASGPKSTLLVLEVIDPRAALIGWLAGLVLAISTEIVPSAAERMAVAAMQGCRP